MPRSIPRGLEIPPLSPGAACPPSLDELSSQCHESLPGGDAGFMDKANTFRSAWQPLCYNQWSLKAFIKMQNRPLFRLPPRRKATRFTLPELPPQRPCGPSLSSLSSSSSPSPSSSIPPRPLSHPSLSARPPVSCHPRAQRPPPGAPGPQAISSLLFLLKSSVPHTLSTRFYFDPEGGQGRGLGHLAWTPPPAGLTLSDEPHPSPRQRTVPIPADSEVRH